MPQMEKTGFSTQHEVDHCQLHNTYYYHQQTPLLPTDMANATK